MWGGRRREKGKGEEREGMWAETFEYLSVIHNVNHRRCRCQRDQRGREKGREERKRDEGEKKGVKKSREARGGGQMTVNKAHLIWNTQTRTVSSISV